MPMIPTKYEYTPPTQIAGAERNFTTKIDVSQTQHGWTVTLNMTSVPLNSASDAQQKLRDELLRIAEQLGGGK